MVRSFNLAMGRLYYHFVHGLPAVIFNISLEKLFSRICSQSCKNLCGIKAFPLLFLVLSHDTPALRLSELGAAPPPSLGPILLNLLYDIQFLYDTLYYTHDR